MNRTSSPGVGQWLTVSLMVVLTIFLLYKLYQYTGFRQYYPAGLTIGGIDVGGMTSEEASQILANRYLEAPVVIYHGEEPFEIGPTQVRFTLDRETMLNGADEQRRGQDFWAGYWGFIWGRPVEIDPVPLVATHDRVELGDILEDIATLSDRSSQPPQPVPATLSFQYGESGTQSNIEASFNDIEAALYRPSNREAWMVIEPRQPQRPEINLLTRLLVNRSQDFSQLNNGVISIYIMDLESGEEVAINENVAMSGMDMLKVPLVLEIYRQLDRRPTLSQQALISDTLVIRPDHESANALLNVVAGSDDANLGASLLTETLQQMGLVNTFMAAPYDAIDQAARRTLATPANSIEGLLTQPMPSMQTTAADMGALLSMIYYCAEGQGGALQVLYEAQITQAECQTILATMQANKVGSLIEEGVPPQTAVAHRHGWISDTHGDAAIISSAGGKYVIVVFIYKPDWLEWELSSPLIADISRATYNYFNFDDPYLGNARTN